jgi:hypothetical protein
MTVARVKPRNGHGAAWVVSTVPAWASTSTLSSRTS